MNIYEQIEKAILNAEKKWSISVMLIRLCTIHQWEYTEYIKEYIGYSDKKFKGKPIIHETLNDAIERCIVCEEL